MSDLIFGHWAALSIKWSPVNIYSAASKYIRFPEETCPDDAEEFSHEYDIFNSVVRVAYKLPEDFPDVIADLIKKLVVRSDVWSLFHFLLSV